MKLQRKRNTDNLLNIQAELGPYKNMYLEGGWLTYLQGKTSLEEKPQLTTAHLKNKVCNIIETYKHLANYLTNDVAAVNRSCFDFLITPYKSSFSKPCIKCTMSTQINNNVPLESNHSLICA